jgi:hypothetical protein
MVVHDLRVVAGHCPGHNIVHGVGKGQGQVVGLALAQHFGQITLGVYVKQENFLSFQRKTGPQVIDSRAFANSALLICYAYHFRFRHFGVPSFHGFSRLRRNRRLCTGIEKAAFPMQKRRPIQSGDM